MKKVCICSDETLTAEEKWSTLNGTDFLGNLPQHKKSNHVGYCWKPCPYSTQATDDETRAMLNLSDTDPIPIKVNHYQDDKNYYMVRAHQGSWGFRCIYEGCTYYLDTGVRYFYR